MITFRALIDAIVNEATYQGVLHECDGLASLTSRLALLLQNRGIDTSRSLFMTVMQADNTIMPVANAGLLEQEIHDAEATHQLVYVDGASMLTCQRKLH